MIPILFDANADVFTTQGLGRLTDAISCLVSEERNGSYELEMEYPVDGIHWSDVATSRIILAKPNDTSDPQAFRIYKITKPFRGRCMVYAEHISYQLSYIPVMPFTAESFAAALAALPVHAAEACPFSVWTDKDVENNYTLDTPMSFRSILGGTQGSLLDVFGTAEYEFDNYQIKAHLNRGTNRGVVLRYGKNITDLSQEESIADTITGICPYWQDPESGTTVTLTEKVVWSANHSNFPFERTVVMDFSSSFEEQPTEAQLRARAQKYIEDNGIGVPDVNITLSFIPLWQSEEYKDLAKLEHVSLCDTITVVFDTLDVKATAKVVKTTYDVLRERYTSIEIGDAKTTLAKQIASVNDTIKTQASETTSILTAAINTATAKIMGGKGGYVKFNYNANGEPEELLVLSSATEATSQNIIRMNQAGIGFSTDYGLTYSTAWTIDGVFNANFITAGSLSANIITAGVLQDVNGYTSFNLATGALTITKGSIRLGTYDSEKQRFPFTVDDNGSLTAVSASLVDATLTGTVTTVSGYFTSSLGNGYLQMYYDGTLYGRFGSAAWANNSNMRGIGMYMEEGTAYMIFGRYSSTDSAYLATHLINFGLTAQESIYYQWRHIFFGDTLFTTTVKVTSTLTADANVAIGGNLTVTGTITLSTSNLIFGNGYGIRLMDSYAAQSVALYMSSSDYIVLGNAAYPISVFGSTTNLGSASYPTVIAGSTVKADNLIKNGKESVTVSNGTNTESISFSSNFPAVPTVVITPAMSTGANGLEYWISNVTRAGFTVNIYNPNSGNVTLTIHWIAVYQPT